GGIPIDRGKHSHMTESIVSEFDKRQVLRIAVTPEGTRSPNSQWHKGFLHIAREADVQLVLAYFDYNNKVMNLEQVFKPSEDVESDIVKVKEFYKTHGSARYPSKFTT
ncbi:MAG: acyltransferase, partial [Muribaculaceae bacterium]|nr:acyltransferase [Muribaculaceae bacterium]